jgi:hypothetical protein
LTNQNQTKIPQNNQENVTETETETVTEMEVETTSISNAADEQTPALSEDANMLSE